MRRLSIVEFSSLSTLLCAGLFIGCGDNIAKQDLMDGGSGGSNSDGAADRTDAGGGTGGSAGAGIAGNGGNGGGRGGSAGSGGLGGNAGNGGGGAGGVATTCPVVAFTSPLNSAVLTAADDASGMSCATGFKYNVKLSVTAADGTVVELHGSVVPGNVASPPLLATALVSGNAVTFPNVQLSEGSTTLTVEIAGVKCTPAVTVTVSCKLPTCSISLPTHDLLNGVAAPAGDRASSAGSDFQAAFAVTTDIEDGQPVVLTVTSMATPAVAPVTITATAASGKASFAGVTLKPDGQYGVTATCTNKAAAVGHSMSVTYTVDTTAPTLTVDQPANGSVIGPTGLTNGAFRVCGTTTSADAVNLPVSAGAAASNLCVTRGQTTTCVPVTAVATSTCVNVACPGGAPFDLSVKLFDAAGNPTTNTVTGISCASTLPSVEIVAPLTDAPNFTDATKRLLSSTATQTLKDADGATAGAQTTVVACTDTVGGSAKLFVGHKGDATLTALGAAVTVVAAVAGDNCSNGKGFVAKFAGVTLPESTEAADGSLTAATELRVDVTDPTNVAAVGTSGPTDLWVDSTNPTLSEKTPLPLCGSTQIAPSGSTTFTSDVGLNSSTPVVTLLVTNGMGMAYGPPTYTGTAPAGYVTFTAVAFPQGDNLVDILATDPAGNTASLTPPMPMPTCKVTVGSAPVVTFTSPAAGKNLCANGNAATTCVADATPGAGAAAGWQGNISVHVTSDGAPLATGNVNFTIGGGSPQTAALNATGDATLTGVTIADSAAVVITATTDNVVGHGTGTASETVVVDTLIPGGPIAVTATVLNRRQTSFTLSWTTPDDNGQTVADYDIHVKVKDSISGDPCGVEVASVPFTGTPVATGSMQSISVSSLFIETDYCFTVTARDVLGNIGPTANGTGRANFNTTSLTGSGTESFASIVDGTSDFGASRSTGGGVFANDGMSDLLVGSQLGSTTAQNAYLFFGRSTGYASVPDVTFVGSPSVRFGAAVAAAGDIDGDGLVDIAIASNRETPAKVYIFSRKNAAWALAGGWPASLTAAQANYVITANASYAGSAFGFTLARLGDFDGQAPDDLAIGAYQFGGGAGGVNAGRVVIVRGSSSFASITLPDTTNTIVIDGEVTGDFFGRTLQGLSDHTLVVAAPGTSGPTAVGKVYGFRGPVAGTTSTLMASAASDRTVLPGVQYGWRFGVLGALGQSPAAVAITGQGMNLVDVNLASAADGPFQGAVGAAPMAAIRFTSSTAANSFGLVNIGSVVPGTSITTSLIGGDSVQDLILAGQSDPGNPVYIVSGARIPSMTGTVNLSTAAGNNPTATGIVTIKSKLPSDWLGYNQSAFVLDLNGDGFGDFALSEQSSAAGRAVVFW